MRLWKQMLIGTCIFAATATGFALQAAEENKPPLSPEQQKLEAEYKKVRKEEYLKKIDQREKYYNSMAAEMKAIRKACAGENDEACKAAREHEKATREKLKENRKENREQFKNKMQQYRHKMGKDAPNGPEKRHKQMKEKMKQKMQTPVPSAQQ